MLCYAMLSQSVRGHDVVQGLLCVSGTATWDERALPGKVPYCKVVVAHYKVVVAHCSSQLSPLLAFHLWCVHSSSAYLTATGRGLRVVPRPDGVLPLVPTGRPR